MFSDLTCMNQADEVSCAAMLGLAKQEYVTNQGPFLYNVNHPVCQRFQELSDRGTESSLQFSSLTRDICLKKNQDYNKGEWEFMFPRIQETPKFDVWTKRR